jgi:hypothetical protein
MSSDYNKPAGSSTKASFPEEIRDNIIDNLIMHDGAPTTANLPLNAKRIDSSDGQVYNWNGSSWDSLGYISVTADPVSDIVDGAPAALDTLNELAAALADDDAFATTMTNSLAGKMDKSQNLNDVSNKATARTNLDVYQKSAVDSLLDSVADNAEQIKILYCAPSATGDGSGDDTGNKAGSTTIHGKIKDYDHVRLIMDAGDYTLAGALSSQPFGSGLGDRVIAGKTLEIELLGNCTFNQLELFSSDVVFYKTDANSSVYTATFDYITMSNNSALGVEDGGTTDGQKVAITSVAGITVENNSSILIPSEDITAVSVTVKWGSSIYCGGGNLIQSGSTFHIGMNSTVRAVNLDISATSGGTVEYNSYVEAATSYVTNTPSGATGSYVV